MRRLAIVGVVAVSFGFAAVAGTWVAGLIDGTFLAVSGLGVLAVGSGVWYAFGRRSSPREAARIDPPEPRYRSPVPGEGFDRAVRERRTVGGRRDSALRERLRAAAVDSLVVYQGYDRDRARTAVEQGDWTDDAVAAGYLAVPVSVPTRVTVGTLFRRQSSTETCVRRTLAAIEEVTGG
jgi:hypothetical protein